MSSSLPFTYTAGTAIDLVRSGQLSPSEWLESCLERISTLDAEIGAWAHLDGERARAQSRKVVGRMAVGEDPSPLYGAPIGVKDIFNTYDMPTGRGSRVYQDHQPRNDARVVARLRWSNGVIAGKTNCDEFAVHWPSPTKNPHNLAHTPGGSSSGSAAAVASGMVPLALSSQTLGSTIRPASYCGIYGFKPTFGLLPRTGMLKTTDTLDHVSLMSRSVEDTRLLLETTRLSGLNYPFIHENVDRRLGTREIERKWRVAVLVPPSWVDAEEHANISLQALAQDLGQAGAEVALLELPADFERAHAIHDTIYNVMLSYYFKEEYAEHRQEISDWFAEMVEAGLAISTEGFVAALEEQRQLDGRLDDVLRPYDVLLTLSSSGEAPEGRFSRNKTDTCLIWTLCRVPAMSVPAFRGPSGLPFGAQLVARRYDDFQLLDFASFMKSRELISDAEIAHVGVAT